MQFQFSVCMYGTCGRIDNKADFDFDFDLHMRSLVSVSSSLYFDPDIQYSFRRCVIVSPY